MKPMLRGIAVAVAAVGVVACVQQAWRVTYAGPGDYSAAHVLAVGDDGTSYIGGLAQPNQLFVAAYRANGSLLWEQFIDAGSAGNNLFPGKMIALDADGDLYFASLRFPELATSLYKLDGQTGELTLSTELEEGEAFNQMQVGPDGLLYMGGWTRVAAYSAAGQLLWSHGVGSSMSDEIENGDVPPNIDLGPYLDGAAASEVASTSANATELYRLERFAFVNGRTYVMFGDHVVELDAAGDVLNELKANELGVNSFESLTATDDGLMAVAQENGAVVSILFDLELVQRSRYQLATGQWRDVRISSGNEYVCVGLYEPVSKAIEIQRMSSSGGPVWAANVAQVGNVEWEFAHVLAAGNECYLGLPVQLSMTEFNTVTRRYDSNGKLTDTINLQQFQPSGLGVRGGAIYHAGISGTADPVNGIATLIKHQRY